MPKCTVFDCPVDTNSRSGCCSKHSAATLPPLPDAGDAPPPLPPPRTSAAGHWTSTPSTKRPTTPVFDPDVEAEANKLEKIICDFGGGMMLLPSSGWDLIVPGIAIGEAHSALDTEMLVANGFTHVLNTCACEEGDDESFHVCTGPDYYEGKLVYSGFHAHDRSDYDISADFEKSNAFLSRVCKPYTQQQQQQPIATSDADGATAGDASVDAGGAGGTGAGASAGGGVSGVPLPDAPCTQIMGRKVMVHCKAGASRSASAVLAFFVHAGMPLQDAVRLVRTKREIAPNNGFLRRLVVYARDVEAKRATLD